MDCGSLKIQLAAREAITAEAQIHLDGCESCRRFAAEIETVCRLCQRADQVAPSTPPVLRHRTLWRSRKTLAEQVADRELSPRQRWGRKLTSAPVVATTVVILGMILLTFTTWELAQSQDETMRLPFKLILGLIVAQNIMAALLMPAMFVWRNRNSSGPLTAFARGE